MTRSIEELHRERMVTSGLGLNPFPWYKQMRLTDPVSPGSTSTF